MTIHDFAPERVIRATWFRSRCEPNGRAVTFERGELAAMLACPGPLPPGGKAALPLIAWATFRGGHRALADVLAVHALGLDIDEPTADPVGLVARARDALGGVEVYAHSTASSAPGAYRLRLVVPYDAPASAADHRASWAAVARLLARVDVEVDRACSDASRGYYAPAVPPSGGVYWHGYHPGQPWPVARAAHSERERSAEESLRQAARPRPAPASRTSGLDAAERARRYLAHVAPSIAGQGGHRAAFVAALKLLSLGLSEGEAFAILADEWNPRCVPPWSEAELRRKVREAAKARRDEVAA